PHDAGRANRRRVRELNHLARLERLIGVGHAKSAGAHVHQLSKNLQRLRIRESDQNRSFRGLASLAPLLVDGQTHIATSDCSDSYSLSLRLSVRREIPKRAAAFCWCPPVAARASSIIRRSIVSRLPPPPSSE